MLQKSGKWCTAHVRIAWQIHMQQQQSKNKSSGGSGSASNSDSGTPGLDGRPSDPLAPPSHLLAPSAPLHRPELGPAAAGLLAAAHSGAPRNPFEPPSPHYSSLLASAHLGKRGECIEGHGKKGRGLFVLLVECNTLSFIQPTLASFLPFWC